MVRGSRRTEKNQSLKLYTNIAVHFGEQIENTETYEKYLDVYLRRRTTTTTISFGNRCIRQMLYAKSKELKGVFYKQRNKKKKKTIKLAAHII